MHAEERQERHWLDIVREAEDDIRALPAGHSYALYKLVYLAFRHIAPADSFYVCLFVPHDPLPLWFPYNVEGEDEWDEPARLPLRAAGEGPTSTVVHTRRPFVLDGGNEDVHLGGVSFGNLERVSLSAVHVPILTAAGTSRERLHGVVSAQSYAADAYPRDAVRALELLADHMGAWMLREDAPDQANILETQAVGHLSSRPAVAVADAMVEMVRGLRTTAEELARQVPPENALLQRLAQQLCEECRHVQVEALQLPLRLERSETPQPTSQAQESSEAPGQANGQLDVLTKTERRVLERLQVGETDAAMARHLRMQESTVKFHLRNIYRKLDVENRLQAVHLLRQSAPSAS